MDAVQRMSSLGFSFRLEKDIGTQKSWTVSENRIKLPELARFEVGEPDGIEIL